MLWRKAKAFAYRADKGGTLIILLVPLGSESSQMKLHVTHVTDCDICRKEIVAYSTSSM
jgi:hypothetical protein